MRLLPFLCLFTLAAVPALALPAQSDSPSANAANAAHLIARARDAQNRGETDLAQRLAQSAIVADPARPAGYDALGDVYAAAGEPDFARPYYDEALSIDPTDTAAQRALAALDRKDDTHTAKADTAGR